MIHLAIVYQLVMKSPHILTLEFDYFGISQYKARHFKEVNIKKDTTIQPC